MLQVQTSDRVIIPAGMGCVWRGAGDCWL